MLSSCGVEKSSSDAGREQPNVARCRWTRCRCTPQDALHKIRLKRIRKHTLLLPNGEALLKIKLDTLEKYTLEKYTLEKYRLEKYILKSI